MRGSLTSLTSFRRRAALLAMSGIVVGGGALGLVASASSVNAAPTTHSFALPSFVRNSSASGGLSKLLATTRAARTAEVNFGVFSEQTSPYAGNEYLTWQGTGVAAFNPARAAIS